MELIKSTIEEFSMWFQDTDLEPKFPLISRKFRSYKNGQIQEVYRLAKDGVTVGITFCGESPTNFYRIHLFEINSDYHRQGIGTEFYKLVSEQIGSRAITLAYAGKKDGEAHSFWTKMGFVQRFSDGRSHEMINKEYASLSRRYASTKIGHAKIRTVIKETEGKVEIIKINLETNEQIS